MPDLGALVQAHGYWWPNSECKIDRYLKHQYDARTAIRLLDKAGQRRTAVQAGGHVGLWPLYLARRFRKVFTFEPAADNFECLVRNCAKAAHIVARRALLADRESQGQLMIHPSNSGGHRAVFDHLVMPTRIEMAVIAGKGTLGEVLPVTSIDHLGLDDCDLIALDTEGTEMLVLKGAIETIRRCSPIIMYEERGHGKQHGFSQEETEGWLKDRGYRKYGAVSRDNIWAPMGRLGA